MAAIVAEAEVDGAFGFLIDLIEHDIHRSSGEGSIVGIAGNVGLIDLHTLSGKFGHLISDHAGECHGEIGEVAVVVIEEGAGQHVRAGGGKLEGTLRQCGCDLAIVEQVQRTFAEFTLHNSSRLAAKTHGRVAGKLLGGRAADD